MDDRHVVIERDSGSGVGMGVVLGVILAIVLAMALLWFAFGANMLGAAGGGSQSKPNNGPAINITVPNQQPVGPSQPSGGGTQP